MKKLAALILSAGDSSRMGQAKALLHFRNRTFLSVIFESLLSNAIDPIYIVTGKHHSDIVDRHPEFNNLIIRNLEPEFGQLHSLRLGLLELPTEIDGVIVCLVDHPAVTLQTYSQLIDEYNKSDYQIVIPKYENRRGHPVIFDRSVFAELLKTPLDLGARPVVRAVPERVMEVTVDDAGIVADIDTPEEYEKVKQDE